jgi:hypothetical protein
MTRPLLSPSQMSSGFSFACDQPSAPPTSPTGVRTISSATRRFPLLVCWHGVRRSCPRASLAGKYCITSSCPFRLFACSPALPHAASMQPGVHPDKQDRAIATNGDSAAKNSVGIRRASLEPCWQLQIATLSSASSTLSPLAISWRRVSPLEVLCRNEQKKKAPSRPISDLAALLRATPPNVSDQRRTNRGENT